MASYNVLSGLNFTFDGGTGVYTQAGIIDARDWSLTENPGAGDDNDIFNNNELIDDGSGFPAGNYKGYVVFGGQNLVVVDYGGLIFMYSPQDEAISSFPSSFGPGTGNPLITTDLPFCFGPGTLIATPIGEVAVETLAIGDMVRTADGRDVVVKWLGRQKTFPQVVFDEKLRPVRIRAGALGGGLPQADLTVSADHGMIVDGLVINASAMVNGDSIDFVSVADLDEGFTYFHIETEAHDVILANGSETETFIDVAGRAAFDNHQEYLDLYGVERIIPEMERLRVTTRRLLPTTLKARLGLEATDFTYEELRA